MSKEVKIKNTKKRRKAKVKQYIPEYVNESGQVDGEKLGLAMRNFVHGVLDRTKAKTMRLPAPPKEEL